MDNLTTRDVASFAIPFESTLPDSPIVLKNKVKIFDKFGNPVNGIVKWIGKNQQVDTLGIEVVSNYIYIIAISNLSQSSACIHKKNSNNADRKNLNGYKC